ncbi:efflux transporter outer membrane subunit [Tamlana fucoidanivorans]|uniref:Efflux transporter outer membrane subunit n=1 Tax=Allotamlana fucoidanivorans TaxID=2583814 RepID=A0A5C4SE38_9FLAO|nr:efflux transporter outer membrane subunit [Tamlana fucoidanivorans]TNJ41256.1 efflux transporter outer membrane subunit [Tamlana fucoidanivorans]
MKKYIIHLMVILFFGACKIGHKYEGSQINMPDKFAEHTLDSTNLANKEWWKIFNDTILEGYIKEAIANNRNLQIAIARVEEFRQNNRIAKSDLYPAISLNGETDSEKVKSEDASNDTELFVGLSWELDLWGRIRWQRDAALADYLATEEAKSAVLQSLIVDVANTYFELTAYKTELEIVYRTQKAREEGVRLAKLRYLGGLTSETPYRQAESQLANTLTLIPDVKFKIMSSHNRLATLMGKFPEDSIVATSLKQYKVPDTIPMGLPSELLIKRPDIRQAEQEVIAANAEVGVALTNMFPKISLTAEAGVKSSDLSNLFSSPYRYLSAQLFNPIFNAGAYKARQKAAQAVLKQKILAYDQVVFKSFEETSNALGAIKKFKKVRSSLEYLEELARGYLELAELQHINGVVNYIDVLDAQRVLFDAELRLNNAIRDEKIAYTQLYKALGGGW